MIERIGTMRELRKLENRFPKDLLNDLVHFVAILDGEYGENRDYLVQGGYCIVAETEADLEQVREVIDYETLLCEFASYVGMDKDYVYGLYLLGDDFGIVTFMPSALMPRKIATQLKE